MNIKIILIYSTQKEFEECVVTEEMAHLATWKSKKYIVDSLPKDTVEIETGMAESPALGGKQMAKAWFGLEK